MEENVLDNAEVRSDEESEKRHSFTSVLKLELPASQQVLSEARSLISDRDMKLAKLAIVATEDPVLALELLRLSNAMFFTGDRPAITSVRTALVRLGAGTTAELLDSLGQRPRLDPPLVHAAFEALRELSTDISITAQAIASVTHRDLAEVVQVAGLFSLIGNMVACAHFGETYIEVAQGRNSASLAYKLQQDYHFDLRTIHLNYLRGRGIPKEIFYALDRDLQCKTPAQANLRFIVQSAIELVEAATSGRWDRYSPQQPLPSKSNLRMLKLTEYQHSEIFELVGAHLLKDQQAQQQAPQPQQPQEAHASQPEVVLTQTPLEASPEPQHALEETFEPAPPPLTVVTAPVQEVAAEVKPLAAPRMPFRPLNATDLHRSSNFLSQDEGSLAADEESLSSEAQKVIGQLREMCKQCKTTHDALTGVLTLLTTAGPYVRAALVVLGSERDSASVHTAVGPGFQNGELIALDDPLSPLALCLTKINSFNAHCADDPAAPFGVTSFALSPLRVPDSLPALLYADCGTSDSVPMEARRVFRLVVGILNSLLPRLPGGLPKRTTVTIATAPKH